MEASEVLKTCWACKIATQLSSQAQQVYITIPSEAFGEYDELFCDDTIRPIVQG